MAYPGAGRSNHSRGVEQRRSPKSGVTPLLMGRAAWLDELRFAAPVDLARRRARRRLRSTSTSPGPAIGAKISRPAGPRGALRVHATIKPALGARTPLLQGNPDQRHGRRDNSRGRRIARSGTKRTARNDWLSTELTTCGQRQPKQLPSTAPAHPISLPGRMPAKDLRRCGLLADYADPPESRVSAKSSTCTRQRR